MSSFAQMLDEAMQSRPGTPGGHDARFEATLDALERSLSDDPSVRMYASGPRAAWAEELGVALPCDLREVTRAFRRAAFRTHPDRPGGSHESFLRTQTAFQEALASLREGAERARAARLRLAPSKPSSRSFYA